MNLKSCNEKSGLSKWNCGVWVYLWYSFNHCCWLSGGKVPVKKSHSVIDNPEPVRRVMPPRITCTNNITTPIETQMATGRLDADSGDVFSITGAKVQTQFQSVMRFIICYNPEKISGVTFRSPARKAQVPAIALHKVTITTVLPAPIWANSGPGQAPVSLPSRIQRAGRHRPALY